MPGIPPITPYPLPAAGDLPRNTARWKPDPARAVLLIHDMQRYFLKPLPPLMRAELVGTVARLRERSAALGVPVAYTAQPGSMTDKERGLLKDFWGPGMRRAPEDRLMAGELTPEPGDWAFVKYRYSAFARTTLLERLRAAGRDQLIVCGVYAHVGVLMTAVDSFTHDLETFVVADAMADFSLGYHRLALTYAAERCAVVLTAKEVWP